jgi:hypothetical protein
VTRFVCFRGCVSVVFCFLKDELLVMLMGIDCKGDESMTEKEELCERDQNNATEL